MSGGRATVKKGKVRQCGDICSVSPEGHPLTERFYIECRHLKRISLDQLISGRGNMPTMWAEVRRQARSHNKAPMLIAAQNHWPVLLITDEHGSDYLGGLLPLLIAPNRRMDIHLLEEVLAQLPPSNLYDRPRRNAT